MKKETYMEHELVSELLSIEIYFDRCTGSHIMVYKHEIPPDIDLKISSGKEIKVIYEKIIDIVKDIQSV